MKYSSPILACLLFVSMRIAAHEMRPALLQIRQTAPETFELHWKLPRRDQMVLAVRPVFPDWFALEPIGDAQEAGDGALFRFLAKSGKDIHQMEIRFDGIQASLVDVLVHVDLLSGEKFSLLAQPSSPSVVIPEKETFYHSAKTYLLLGVEHILGGPDHLLFVLALLLIVTGTRKLIWTITAFTLAHSLTLSLSVTGFVGLPAPPVEATIALSIVFLAWELVRLQRGEKVISAKKPWLVSFSFGLLHGLGFASALHEVGLPQTQVPAALAFFNVGVELGQLFFIFSMLLLGRIFSGLLSRLGGWWRQVPAYAIGSVSAFWLIERILAFWPEANGS